MRVLFSCHPAVGHFHPMVPLAKALAAAGHEPIFATSASFCPYVERAGLPAVPVGADWLLSTVEQSFPRLVPNSSTMDGLSGSLHRVFARTAGELLPDMRRLLISMRPDVLVCESLEWSGPIAAEAVGVPHALLGITFCHPLPVYARALGRYWQIARKALGLAEDPHLERLCPYLYLDGYPPGMQPQPIGTLIPTAQLIRPVAYQVGDTAPPSWLDDLPDRPTVYVSMGTVFNRVRGAFTPILDGLRDAPYNVIVMVGANGDPDSVGPQPGHVRIERSVPEPAVMARADLVITHAGYNTVVAALSHGLPTLCLPIGGDQTYTAFRVESCGAGLRLDSRTATSEAVGRAVHDLLTDPLYTQNARRLQREIESMPPLADAITALEKLAATGPLPTSRIHSGRGDG
jgi:UDP:flavonoid glycosyltransferase YjiC (YdhE family)